MKIQASGICGSDVLEWYRIKKAPLVLGHEVTGDVTEVGAGVEKYKVGDRVAVSHHVPCNTCRYCLSGNHTVCETLHTTHFDPGGFSEYVRVPKINVDRGVFLLPPEVSYEEGSFMEPLGCVLRGQRLARLMPGQTVLVMGSGISGLLHVMLAKALGAGRVIATDVSQYRLNAARNLGADALINAKEDVPSRLLELNEGRRADLVIVCTGAMPAFTQALKSVDHGGTLMYFATTGPGETLPVPINDYWRNGITLLPSYGNSPYDGEVAISLIHSGRVPVKKMITHRLGLAEAAQGFQLVASAGESIKVIIEPQR